METASNAGTQTAEETLSLSTWQVDNTCFGQILRGPCGRVLFPPDLFDEVDERMKMLSKSKQNPILSFSQTDRQTNTQVHTQTDTHTGRLDMHRRQNVLVRGQQTDRQSEKKA